MGPALVQLRPRVGPAAQLGDLAPRAARSRRSGRALLQWHTANAWPAGRFVHGRSHLHAGRLIRPARLSDSERPAGPDG